MGGCCSSEEEDEERQGLVISEPTAVSSSNPLATAPIPLESPIKSSTGGTPPPGPRLPPRRIRSTGPLPHAHEEAQHEELVERPVTVVPVDPAPPALLSASQKLSPRPGPEAKAAAAAAKVASVPPAAEAAQARKESKQEKKDREKKEKKAKKEAKKEAESAKKEKKEKKKSGGIFGLFSSSSTKEQPADLVIGGPTGFRREQHIGWDPEKGFDLQNLPPQWQTLFSKAGVTEAELRNKDTSLFIINVVAASLGSSAFKPQSTYTPLSSSQTHATLAPAPTEIAPSGSADAGSPPPGEASVSAESSQSSYTSFSQLPPVDSPLSSVSKPAASPRTSAAPPPIPPPRSDSLVSTVASSSDSTPSLAPPLPPSAPKAPPAPAPPVKTALSTAAKPPPAPPAAERPPPPPSRTDTEDLLAAIRAKGAGGLRKVEAPPDLKKLSQQEENSLASILSRAMEARRAYMREDQKDDVGDGGGWD